MWKTVTSSWKNSWLQLSCKSPTCGCNFESSSSANSWCLAKIVPLMSSEPRALDKASNAFVRSPCADSQDFSDPFSKSEALVLRLWCQCWEELLEHRNWHMLNHGCWLLHVVTMLPVKTGVVPWKKCPYNKCSPWSKKTSHDRSCSWAPASPEESTDRMWKGYASPKKTKASK